MADIIHEEIGKLKPGRYILIDGAACIITNMLKSTPGKHGHAKYRIEANDLLTGNKKVMMATGHGRAEVPIIEKKKAQVLTVSGDTAQIMDMESYETFDIKIPAELKDKVIANANVTYWNILDVKVLKTVK